MQRIEKEQVVAELVERLRTSDTLFVADYRGLTNQQIDGVRGELLKHGARFSVVKNTLTRRAAEAAGVTELEEFLQGPTAIAFIGGEADMVAVAKTLNDTARATRILALRGGLLQGRSVTAEQVRDLATLPPAEVLRGQILGAVAAPLYAVVGLFVAPLRDLVNVIDARIKQLEEAGAPAAAAEATPAVEEAPAAEAEPEPEAPAAEEEAPEAPAVEAEPEAPAETEDTESPEEPQED
jgi:large subunit ribosomal protein L10